MQFFTFKPNYKTKKLTLSLHSSSKNIFRIFHFLLYTFRDPRSFRYFIVKILELQEKKKTKENRRLFKTGEYSKYINGEFRQKGWYDYVFRRQPGKFKRPGSWKDSYGYRIHKRTIVRQDLEISPNHGVSFKNLIPYFTNNFNRLANCFLSDSLIVINWYFVKKKKKHLPYFMFVFKEPNRSLIRKQIRKQKQLRKIKIIKRKKFNKFGEKKKKPLGFSSYLKSKSHYHSNTFNLFITDLLNISGYTYLAQTHVHLVDPEAYVKRKFKASLYGLTLNSGILMWHSFFKFLVKNLFGFLTKRSPFSKFFFKFSFFIKWFILYFSSSDPIITLIDFFFFLSKVRYGNSSFSPLFWYSKAFFLTTLFLKNKRINNQLKLLNSRKFYFNELELKSDYKINSKLKFRFCSSFLYSFIGLHSTFAFFKKRFKQFLNFSYLKRYFNFNRFFFFKRKLLKFKPQLENMFIYRRRFKYFYNYYFNNQSIFSWWYLFCIFLKKLNDFIYRKAWNFSYYNLSGKFSTYVKLIKEVKPYYKEVLLDLYITNLKNKNRDNLETEIRNPTKKKIQVFLKKTWVKTRLRFKVYNFLKKRSYKINVTNFLKTKTSGSIIRQSIKFKPVFFLYSILSFFYNFYKSFCTYYMYINKSLLFLKQPFEASVLKRLFRINPRVRVIRLIRLPKKLFLYQNSVFIPSFFVAYKEINFKIKHASLLLNILNDKILMTPAFSKSHFKLLMSGLYRHY